MLMIWRVPIRIICTQAIHFPSFLSVCASPRTAIFLQYPLRFSDALTMQVVNAIIKFSKDTQVCAFSCVEWHGIGYYFFQVVTGEATLDGALHGWTDRVWSIGSFLLNMSDWRKWEHAIIVYSINVDQKPSLANAGWMVDDTRGMLC